jgi:DNA-binding MarR family transcriptional regulator
MDVDTIERTVDVLHRTIVALVRRDGPDLTARQLSVFLTCYLEDQAQTVRGLSAALRVSKPAITRAVFRLAEFNLIRRTTDPDDRRSTLIQRTLAGAQFLRALETILAESAQEAEAAAVAGASWR